MSDPNALGMLWPTYALRAWMTALLGQMERARHDLDSRAEAHEKELARLRLQKERSNTVIESLREAIESVDSVLRRTRDSETFRDREQTAKREHELQESKAELKQELKREEYEKSRSPERTKK